MTIWGFDVDSYNKPNFDFDRARAEGNTVAIVKLGGNNLSGNGPYMMNGYPAFAAQQQQFPTRGAYWVTGGDDPHAAAVFYAQRRHPGTNLDLLDNEKLDSGNPWNDAQCCVFFDTLASFRLPNYNPWAYGSKISLWRTLGPWPGLQARGIRNLTAFYNGAPLQDIVTGMYPASLTLGHQWSSSVTIGGSPNIDADAFTQDAFTTTPKKRKRGSNVSTLYFTDLPSADQIPDELKAIGAVPGRIWALAGDGLGKAAWIESQDGPNWVNSVAQFHAGDTVSVPMSFDGYMNLRKMYLDGATQAVANLALDPDVLRDAVQSAVKGLGFQVAGTIKEG